MDVFKLRDQLAEDYRHYAKSFLAIEDERIRAGGMTWWRSMRRRGYRGINP